MVSVGYAIHAFVYVRAHMLQGYLHLAKSRYSMGAGSVSKLQYDATMTADSLVDVVSNSEHSE